MASILLIQETLIDRDYIARWADTLGVFDEWQLILGHLNEFKDIPEYFRKRLAS